MRRGDAYEARARELCVAAGLDPDSRVDKPGGKTMPAWCAYREAARAERMAAEGGGAGPAAPGRRVSGRAAEGVRPARRGDGRADAQLHGGRQCRRRRAVRRRPPRLCPVGRRRHRLRARSASPASASTSAAATWRSVSTRPSPTIQDRAGAILDDVRQVISFGIGRANDGARRARAVRRCRRVAGVRHERPIARRRGPARHCRLAATIMSI